MEFLGSPVKIFSIFRIFVLGTMYSSHEAPPLLKEDWSLRCEVSSYTCVEYVETSGAKTLQPEPFYICVQCEATLGVDKLLAEPPAV